MEDNKMYTQHMYKCAICGTIHESIPARIKCETMCYQQQELEIKKAEEAKKKEEQMKRKAEVDAAFDKAMQLREAYLKDYNTYTYEYSKVSNNPEDNEWEDWHNSKSLWHFFM